jgi:serine/threonine protein kinase
MELCNETKNFLDIPKQDNEERSWTTDDFEFGESLGNGKFGYVYRAVEKNSGKEVAIKVICKNVISQFNFYEQIKSEVEIHSRLM